MGRLGAGCILTLHSGLAPSYVQSLGRHRWIARRICWLFDRVIGVNAEIVKALTGLGIPPQKLELLPAYLAAAPSGALSAAVNEFFREHWPVFTTVLFFRPEYGFEFLLEALARLRTTYPKLGCMIMGGGKNDIECELRRLDAGIGGTVMLLGDVPHEECLEILSRSQVFLRCTFSDADAVSVREALSLGVPTVASDVGHRPDGVLLFPAGHLDALISQIDAALNRRFKTSLPGKSDMAFTGLPRLLEIYQHLPLERMRGWKREEWTSCTGSGQ